MEIKFAKHDSHNQYYRHPFGAVECSEKIQLRIKIQANKPINSVQIKVWLDGKQYKEVQMDLEEVIEGYNIYKGDFIPTEIGVMWYYFTINLEGSTHYYGNNYRMLGGLGELYSCNPYSYQITVHKKNLTIPHWYKESVMYQIFPDRFYNGLENGSVLNPKKNSFIYSNWYDKPIYIKDPRDYGILRWEFYGGNLLGIIKKLNYLKELGINIIYLNPIFESPSNHRYDTSNYKSIDPMLGDEEIFKTLCQKAKEMGISIILDGVFSHTGSDSVYFNREGNYEEIGAYQSQKSPYYSWYKFYKFPNSYDCWWGFGNMPNVNELDPSFQNYIIYDEDSVIKHWMKLGVKGWRLDVVDELPGAFVKAFKQEMKKVDEESILIGEVWEDASNKVSYGERRQYLLGEELDSTMNYPFRKILLDYFMGNVDAEGTALAFMSLYENYPKQHFYSVMNLIGSHDIPRILTMLKRSDEESELAIRRLKLMVVFQMTFPGVPCVYYGDEVGVEGYEDPSNRSTYPWDMENIELLNWYKQLIQLRHDNDALKTGEWQVIYADGDVFGYIRTIKNHQDVFGVKKENQVAIILFNRSVNQTFKVELNINKWVSADGLIDVLDDKKNIKVQEPLKIELRPLEVKIFIDRLR